MEDGVVVLTLMQQRVGWLRDEAGLLPVARPTVMKMITII